MCDECRECPSCGYDFAYEDEPYVAPELTLRQKWWRTKHKMLVRLHLRKNLDLTTANTILQEYYVDAVREELNSANKLIGQIMSVQVKRGPWWKRLLKRDQPRLIQSIHVRKAEA